MSGSPANGSLSKEAFTKAFLALDRAQPQHDRAYPGDTGRRQPVHTVYGGAQIFKSTTAGKLGELAVRFLDRYAPDAQSFAEGIGIAPELAAPVYASVREKLTREPVEDFRIDFEDGYGHRSDDEEDEAAVATGAQVAVGMKEGTLSPFIGIRIKSLTPELRYRSARTLDLFVTSVCANSGGKLPPNFVVTLPKIVMDEEVAALADLLDALESKLGLDNGAIPIEIMIETAQSIIGPDGRAAMPGFIKAARGRCIGAHFGTYDYTAGYDIIARFQQMQHPGCDFAKHMMKVSLLGTGVHLSDGATNIMPVPIHKGPDADLSKEQIAQNQLAVFQAWKVHADNVRHSLKGGFYQGWDLHPGHLPSRYGATFAFFLEGMDEAAARLRNFVEKAAQATLVGDVFDDAATGQGLLNYFLRAVNCGALTQEQAAEQSGLTKAELESRSFLTILSGRS